MLISASCSVGSCSVIYHKGSGINIHPQRVVLQISPLRFSLSIMQSEVMKLFISGLTTILIHLVHANPLPASLPQARDVAGPPGDHNDNHWATCGPVFGAQSGSRENWVLPTCKLTGARCEELCSCNAEGNLICQTGFVKMEDNHWQACNHDKVLAACLDGWEGQWDCGCIG